MDKRTLTSEQKAALEKMKEIAGDLFFESWVNESLEHLDVLYGLTDVLGQLYGEVIRQTHGREDLHNKVTSMFMCSMAVKPNFGREEEDKSAGQLLYESQEEEASRPLTPWLQQPGNTRQAFENEAMTRAEGKERDAERGVMPVPCPKCHGSGNMSLLGAYEKCDAC